MDKRKGAEQLVQLFLRQLFIGIVSDEERGTLPDWVQPKFTKRDGYDFWVITVRCYREGKVTVIEKCNGKFMGFKRCNGYNTPIENFVDGIEYCFNNGYTLVA